jgi:hypothetical protein
VPLPDSLATLEQQRSSILTLILELGDFRSGSITTIEGPLCALTRDFCYWCGVVAS